MLIDTKLQSYYCAKKKINTPTRRYPSSKKKASTILLIKIIIVFDILKCYKQINQHY